MKRRRWKPEQKALIVFEALKGRQWSRKREVATRPKRLLAEVTNPG